VKNRRHTRCRNGNRSFGCPLSLSSMNSESYSGIDISLHVALVVFPLFKTCFTTVVESNSYLIRSVERRYDRTFNFWSFRWKSDDVRFDCFLPVHSFRLNSNFSSKLYYPSFSILLGFSYQQLLGIPKKNTCIGSARSRVCVTCQIGLRRRSLHFQTGN
jgi:hypothetical protein